jgi:hypothetical protein
MHCPWLGGKWLGMKVVVTGQQAGGVGVGAAVICSRYESKSVEFGYGAVVIQGGP